MIFVQSTITVFTLGVDAKAVPDGNTQVGATGKFWLEKMLGVVPQY